MIKTKLLKTMKNYVRSDVHKNRNYIVGAGLEVRAI